MEGRWRTLLKLTCGVCGTKLSTLGRNLVEPLGVEHVHGGLHVVRARDQLLHINVQRFRGGLVCKAHRLCVERDLVEALGVEHVHWSESTLSS